MIAALVIAWIVRDEWRKARRRRYITRLHSRPASLEQTMATFWLGSMYARYGSDRQLDAWYEIVHGVQAT